MKKFKGHVWKIEKMGEESYSLTCRDSKNNENILWPDDAVVSKWIGRQVVFLDGGDDPDYPEAIFIVSGE